MIVQSLHTETRDSFFMNQREPMKEKWIRISVSRQLSDYVAERVTVEKEESRESPITTYRAALHVFTVDQWSQMVECLRQIKSHHREDPLVLKLIAKFRQISEDPSYFKQTANESGQPTT